MFVISRNTAFTYGDKRVDTKQVGRELGVRYVLEGSIRRSGSRVRVTAQLIAAELDAHIWAERFNADTADLFALQDEVTSRIANTLDAELIAREAARPTEHPDALDCILRGRAVLLKPSTPDTYIEQSVSSSMHCSSNRDLSRHRAGWRSHSRVGCRSNEHLDPADIASAEGLVRQALEIVPRSPLAHYAKGQLLRVHRRYVEAIPEYETALAYNRNWVHAFRSSRRMQTFCRLDRRHDPACRASHPPQPPGCRHRHLVFPDRSCSSTAIAHRRRYRLAQKKACGANPELPYAHSHLASAYALRGETEGSAIELAEARKLSRDGRYSSITRLQASAYYGVPKVRALFEATYFTGLRKAGMPEG